MQKPCRLEMNANGSWKLLGKFDAADDQVADNVLECAANLVEALNEATPGRGAITLRVTSDDAYPAPLMRYRGRESGWRDSNGAPA